MEPEVITFTDSAGNKLSTLQIGDDRTIPIPGLKEALPQLRDFEFKENDIMISTYPRSGTHLSWEIIRMLKNNSAAYIEGEKESESLELFTRNKCAEKSDRVLNTHLPPKLLPLDIYSGKCKIVHVYRNPKDVMVSLYNFVQNFKPFYKYDGSFSNFFELAIKGEVSEGSWFEFQLQMEEFFNDNPQIPSIMIGYEDLLEDPIGTMRTLSKFLGLSRDEKLFHEIKEAIHFKKMKAAKFELKSNILKPEASLECYNNMYRKGKSGDWKNWLTVAQNEELDQEFERLMTGSCFEKLIKWSVKKST